MAEIGHKFFEFLLIVEETFAGEEGEGDRDLPRGGVGADEDVPI